MNGNRAIRRTEYVVADRHGEYQVFTLKQLERESEAWQIASEPYFTRAEAEAKLISLQADGSLDLSSGLTAASPKAAVSTTNSVSRILYCHARAGTKTIEPGHWFFHTGRYTICAEGRYASGRGFTLALRAQGSTPVSDGPHHFDSLNAAKDWLAGYFGVPVVNARVRDLPRPEDL